MGQEKLVLGHKKMNYGTEQGDFLGQEKLTYGHNEQRWEKVKLAPSSTLKLDQFLLTQAPMTYFFLKSLTQAPLT